MWNRNKRWFYFKRLVLLPTFAAVLLINFENCGQEFGVLKNGANFLDQSSTLNFGPAKTNPFQCVSNTPTAKQLQRLSKIQYANSIGDLVGAKIQTQISDRIDTLYTDNITKDVSSFANLISDAQMTAYQSIAESVYMILKNDLPTLQTIGGACLSDASLTQDCKKTFINQVGLHAFRRPLTSAEVDEWMTRAFSVGSSPADSAALVIYGMMLTPDFLLHLELGDTSSTDASSVTLSPYEVASRLSYGIMDSPPDAALYEAAQKNQLSTLAQIATQVDRLLQTDSAHKKVLSFFNYWVDPRRYSASIFASDLLQGFDVTAGDDEFAREMLEYVEYMVFKKHATFNDLITSRESFARTPAAAAAYGHAPVSGQAPAVTSSERKGLLMRAPVLATEGNETHPIVRGVKFRNRFLCENLGLPSGIMTSDPKFFSDTARTAASTRTRTAGITAGTACMTCHQNINPIGFAFENFDGLGRKRKIENAYSLSGTLLAQHAIVTDSPDLLMANGTQHVTVHDGLDLIDNMTSYNQLASCFVRQVHRYYTLQFETPEDNCKFKDVYNKFMIDDPNAPMLGAIRNQFVTENIFKRRLQQ